MPTFFALIAQSVEHAAVNRSVTGSSPVWGAKKFLVLLNKEFFNDVCKANVFFLLWFLQFYAIMPHTI